MENIKTGCRIKSVKFKNGGHIEVLPKSRSNYRRVYIPHWGEVVFRCFDDDPITNADMCYMADTIKDLIRNG